MSEIKTFYRNDPGSLGIANGTLKSMKLKEEWNFPVLNVGIHTASKASPAVDDSGIYVGADSGWFYALDFSGNLRWKIHAASARFGIHGTAATDDKRVFFGAYNGHVYALDKYTGRLLWQNRVGDAIGASLVLKDGYVYANVETSFPANGFMIRMRPHDGFVNWLTYWWGDQSHSTPVFNDEDGLIHFGANTSEFHGLDPETNRPRWTFKAGAPIKSSPSLLNGRVYFTSWDGHFYALNAKSGEVVWKTKLGDFSQSSQTYVPSHDIFIFASTRGGLFGVRASDGEMVWRRQTPIKRMHLASGLAIKSADRPADNPWVVWIPCDLKRLCALNPATGETLHEVELRAHMTSVPVYHDGAIYVALDVPGGLSKFVPEN